MSRRKGSKNRSTLERELTAANISIDTKHLSYSQLAAQLATQVAPVVTEKKQPVQEPVERSIIDPEQAKAIIEDTRRRFGIMVGYYASGDDGQVSAADLIPERIQEFLRSNVYLADSVETARTISLKALDKLETHLLTLWGKKINGPRSSRNIQSRANKAKKWAIRLEKLGKPVEANKQRERASAILAVPPDTRQNPWLN
jgi:hypothetical protein